MIVRLLSSNNTFVEENAEKLGNRSCHAKASSSKLNKWRQLWEKKIILSSWVSVNVITLVMQ